MRNRSALLVGGSFSALPFLQILKDEGFRVIVAGRDPGEPCHALADASLLIDYSDKHELLKACMDLEIDCIVPTCNDYSYLAAAHVASHLGVAGFDPEEIALTIHTKQRFKQFAQKTQLKSPQPLMWDSMDEAEKRASSKRRLIVKPDDAFSGIGVSVVEGMDALSGAIDSARKASGNGKIVIEEFFDGSLHSHSCFLQDQKIVREFLVDEFCTLNAFQVNCSNYPSNLPTAAGAEIHNEIERMAEQLSLADGLLHTQFLWNGSEIQIVECMRRCPGDLYGRQMELSEGFPYHYNVIAPYLGQAFRLPATSNAPRPVGRHTIGSADPALVASIRIDAPVSQMEFIPLKRSGETISGKRTDKAGIIFFIHDAEKVVPDLASDYGNRVSIEPACKADLFMSNKVNA